jgi:Na+/melibiose symporter-like transporter
VVLMSAAVALLAVFLFIEWRSAHPLMPLRLFAIRHVWASACIGMLWSAAMFAWFFMSALYMQQVLGLGPRVVGLAFLPSNVIMAVFSVGISARMVTRFGFRAPLTWGLLLAGAGLALFARAPVAGELWRDVMPGMALLGLGAGMALNPLLMAAMSDVDAAESGVASGVVNTAFMMGGALGLAILASLAGARTESLMADGADVAAALAGGYRLAFGAGAACAAVAAVIAFCFISRGAVRTA